MWVVVGVCVPAVHMAFGGEADAIEEALLAPLSPSPCDEGSAAEAGTWEVVDDFTDEFSGK